MIPEIGHFALILALCLALVQSIFPLLGDALKIPTWVAVARRAAWGQFFFMCISFAALTYAFIGNDFSVAYVAQNSNSQLPLAYRISAVWGAHEGSLLLWALILCIWTVAVASFSKALPQDTVSRVIAVMGLISIGFLLFIIMTSDPFERIPLAYIPADGRDLNPLLQDFGLIVHPPMLYMGYVGFSVAFAFAVAALIGGRLDATWARWSRPWTTLAWIFMTLGISLGSWWAYYELGWGGWWFWDPVENASFMPWLIGTALIHSLAVTEKRNTFKVWTILLAILAFSLSLLGTFLVRSGVLTSVHAFASDPERGLFILIFLGIVVGGSLSLFAWRAPSVKGVGNFQLLSRETFLLSNNVLLVVVTATVLLGTLYPLLLDALGMGKISVGPPYFNLVFVPLMALLILLMGVGPNARWKKNDAKALINRLRIPFIASIVLAIAIVLVIYRDTSPLVMLGLALAIWIVFSLLADLRAKLANRGNLMQGLASLPRSYYSMAVAHIGVAVFTIGVTLTSAYSVERDIRMSPNQSVKLADYEFRFEPVRDHTGPNYQASLGTIRVFSDGKEVAVLHPEKRYYFVQRNPMTEADINAGLFRDLYVALGEPLPGSKDWAVRLYYKPFIRWIWLGTIIMALGGLLAVTDRRYRLLLQRKATNIKQTIATATATG